MSLCEITRGHMLHAFVTRLIGNEIPHGSRDFSLLVSRTVITPEFIVQPSLICHIHIYPHTLMVDGELAINQQGFQTLLVYVWYNVVYSYIL